MRSARCSLLTALLVLSAVLLSTTLGPAAADAAPGETSQPAVAHEIETLERLLLEGDAGERGYRGAFDLRETDSMLQAITRLSQLGTPRAVEVLYRFLVRPDADRRLKGSAITALGQIGTEQAVSALTRFDHWAEKRRTTPAPFTFGPKEFAIYHFHPLTVEPTATQQAPDGQWWAIFKWDKFGLQNEKDGKPDWWVTSSADRKSWKQPILVPQPDHPSNWLAEVAREPSRLAPFTRDTDQDNLPNLLETRLGTDPKTADSDGDGVADGTDGNPLTPAGKVAGDEADIRQAVFSILFATADSDYPIYVVDRGQFASQEYRGHRGTVLRSPAIKRGRVNITDIEVELSSPTSASASIHDYEDTEAGSYHKAVLRKLHGRWVVVEFRLQGIA